MTERIQRVAVGTAADGAGILDPTGRRAGCRLAAGLRIPVLVRCMQCRGIPQAAVLAVIERQRRLGIADAAEVLLIRAILQTACLKPGILNDNMAVLPADDPAGVAAAGRPRRN